MFDAILDFGCGFDWITPAWAFVQDFLNRPASHFGVPGNAMWGRRDLRRLLRKYGVKVWGLMYDSTGDLLMFAVPKSQARWAYYCLEKERVPILYAPREVAASYNSVEIPYLSETGLNSGYDATTKKKRSKVSSRAANSSKKNSSLFPKGFFGGPLD
jgi:hypothetical protein